MLCSVAALSLATPACAQLRQGDPEHSQTIRYADLDLALEGDADELLTRIRAAARRVCDIHGGMSTLDEFALERACRRETIANAVEQLGNPVVTARFNNNGRPVQTAAAR
jgi:UrcA family protein